MCSAAAFQLPDVWAGVLSRLDVETVRAALMSREGVLPRALGHVHPTRRTPYVAIAFTTLLAFALITFVGTVPALGGTTALLLLCVFTVVNIAVLVLRRDPVGHQHFRTPTFLPIVGAVACAFLAGPWTGRDPVQYRSPESSSASASSCGSSRSPSTAPPASRRRRLRPSPAAARSTDRIESCSQRRDALSLFE